MIINTKFASISVSQFIKMIRLKVFFQFKKIALIFWRSAMMDYQLAWIHDKKPSIFGTELNKKHSISQMMFDKTKLIPNKQWFPTLFGWISRLFNFTVNSTMNLFKLCTKYSVKKKHISKKQTNTNVEVIYQRMFISRRFRSWFQVHRIINHNIDTSGHYRILRHADILNEQTVVHFK